MKKVIFVFISIIFLLSSVWCRSGSFSGGRGFSGRSSFRSSPSRSSTFRSSPKSSFSGSSSKLFGGSTRKSTPMTTSPKSSSTYSGSSSSLFGNKRSSTTSPTTKSTNGSWWNKKSTIKSTQVAPITQSRTTQSTVDKFSSSSNNVIGNTPKYSYTGSTYDNTHYRSSSYQPTTYVYVDTTPHWMFWYWGMGIGRSQASYNYYDNHGNAVQNQVATNTAHNDNSWIAAVIVSLIILGIIVGVVIYNKRKSNFQY